MTTPTPNERMLIDAHKSRIHYSAMKVEAELRNAQHENKTDAALIEDRKSVV